MGEEVREDRIGEVLSWLQAQARGKASRLVFKKMQDQKLALYCLQRTIRNYYIGKTWLWWQLWLAVKPNLKCTKFAQYKAEYEEKIAIAEANIDKAVAECNKVKADAERLKGEIRSLESSMEACEEDKMTKDNQIRTLKEELAHQEELISKLQKEKKGVGETRQKTEEDIQSMEDKC